MCVYVTIRVRVLVEPKLCQTMFIKARETVFCKTEKKKESVRRVSY
jgi:hypothetical protein